MPVRLLREVPEHRERPGWGVIGLQTVTESMGVDVVAVFLSGGEY